MKKIIASITLVLGCLSMGGCAFDVMSVKQIPTTFTQAETCGGSFTLAQDSEIQLGGGYKRILKKDTNWFCMGKITQGDVYGTEDQILTIEASNVYEAKIVVIASELIGFYLPVEGTFSPLSDKVQLITH